VDSDGVEATVVVKNPCNFPIEFYTLDFDEQYLEKEKVRRQVHVHAAQASQHSSIPRLSPFLGSEGMERMVRIKCRQEADFSPWFCTAAYHRTVLFSPESMVEETGNPVSRAVLHHPGIAPSSGRREAQQYRGIVVIVHGPPQAGKTEIAVGLCQYYDAAYVSIDAVVKEAMAND
ncbi:HYDIN protein, partial [Cardinalis cardinalis]|nr:HYDIN protein [Cardinalis cardinalis]